MREIYALRIFSNCRQFLSGRMEERLSFKDLYGLVDYVEGNHLNEVPIGLLRASEKVYECVHYPSGSEDGKVITHYQKTR